MNVIRRYTDYISDNLKDYTKLILEKYYDEQIFNLYLNKYINIRYYNQCIINKGNIENTLNYYLNEIYKEYSSDISKITFDLFKLYYYLDGVKKSSNLKRIITDINDLRETKLNLKDDNINILKTLISENEKWKKKYLKSFNTKDFSLNTRKYVGKTVYDISLVSNVDIPVLFSEEAIRNVLESSRIAIDKLFIEYYLVNVLLLKYIIKNNFSRRYLIEFNSNIFKNNIKLNKLLDIMDNDISKSNILFKVEYKDFMLYQDNYFKLRKDGFTFALMVNDKDEYTEAKNKYPNFFSLIVIPKGGK